MHLSSMAISDRIRASRVRLGMKATELAREMDVNRSAVSQWEKGPTFPNIDNRIKLSRILKISITELLEGEELSPKEVTLLPQEVILIQKFRQLPEPMREAYLRILMVQLDSLNPS